MKIINLGETDSLLNQYMAQIRDKSVQKDSLRFRNNLVRIGEIFAYELSKTLTFTADEPTQYIKFKIIDNDEFGGDVKMTVKLVNAQGVQLGANKT